MRVYVENSEDSSEGGYGVGQVHETFVIEGTIYFAECNKTIFGNHCIYLYTGNYLWGRWKTDDHRKLELQVYTDKGKLEAVPYDVTSESHYASE